jgi:hypothetical protein
VLQIQLKFEKLLQGEVSGIVNETRQVVSDRQNDFFFLKSMVRHFQEMKLGGLEG